MYHRTVLLACCCSLHLASLAWAERPKISEDRELKEIDLTGWSCLRRPAGTARTPDAIERNRLKNRSVADLVGTNVETMDTAAFLGRLADFDSQTERKRRKDLSPAQKKQLEKHEKQLVSLTGYLVFAYAGPPESTNCGSTDFHDWHLEVFAEPADHPPRVGDPTPIICEVTPRTQNTIYRSGIRLQALAAFIRTPDLSYEPTGHPARKIRVIGNLLWDDEHNGAADVGVTIQAIGANKYHHPWRSTAWEIHPITKIDVVDSNGPGAEGDLTTPRAADCRFDIINCGRSVPDHGRQITESEPETKGTAKSEGQQRESKEGSDRRHQSRAKEEIELTARSHAAPSADTAELLP